MEELDTKNHVTRKFMIGVGLIIGSLILGKAVLIPIILFPGNEDISLIMLIIYIVSWPIILLGIWMAGMEGYRLATNKYKDFQRKTVLHVKRGGQKAAHHVKDKSRKAVHHVQKGGRKAAEGTKKVAQRTVQRIKKPIEKSERTFGQK